MSSYSTVSLAVTAFALGTLARSDITSPTGLAIHAEHASYAFATSSGPRVQVTMVNTSGRTLRLAACGGWIGHRMERESDGRWIDATQTSCGSTPFEPLTLAPGDSVRTEVNPLALGKYRVRAVLYRDDWNVRYSPEASEPFEIY